MIVLNPSIDYPLDTLGYESIPLWPNLREAELRLRPSHGAVDSRSSAARQPAASHNYDLQYPGTFPRQCQTETHGHRTLTSPGSFLRQRQTETLGHQAAGNLTVKQTIVYDNRHKHKYANRPEDHSASLASFRRYTQKTRCCWTKLKRDGMSIRVFFPKNKAWRERAKSISDTQMFNK